VALREIIVDKHQCELLVVIFYLGIDGSDRRARLTSCESGLCSHSLPNEDASKNASEYLR